MNDINTIRAQFPQLTRKVYGKDLLYLDHAATSLRPVGVLEKFDMLSKYSSANIHRALHAVAEEATAEYEDTRKAVAEYLNAEDSSEIVFTSGTTASLNLVAFCFGERFIKEGDEIIVSESEHHSNIVPWQMMAQRKGASIVVLPVDSGGRCRTELLSRLITEKTRVLAIEHVSNVTGLVNPIREVCRVCHERGVAVVVDGAQGIVHLGVDVQEMDCDFYAFSGHKIYATTGTGVLYGKKEYLDELPPFMGGGEMISTVSWKGTTYAKAPYKFEAGTQNYSGIPTLKPAMEMLRQMESIRDNEQAVKEYVYGKLSTDPRIVLCGTTDNLSERVSLFSFYVKGVHHQDLAMILDKMGIATRSGQMCAEPLMDALGVTGLLRVSFAPYNTKEEADKFFAALDRAIDMLQ